MAAIKVGTKATKNVTKSAVRSQLKAINSQMDVIAYFTKTGKAHMAVSAEKTLNEAIETLEFWGYTPVLENGVYSIE